MIYVNKLSVFVLSLVFYINLLCVNSVCCAEKLLVAAENYPPFEYMENGKIKGANVEIVSKIFDRIGVDFEIKFYPWSRVWLLLQKGKADLTLTISYKKFREPYIHYAPDMIQSSSTEKPPKSMLWMTEFVFFINNKYKSTFKYESLEQLQKEEYRIGVIKDYSYNSEFLKAKLNRVSIANFEEGLKKLLNGEIDLLPYDIVSGKSTLKKLKYQDKISYLDKRLLQKPYSVGFSKKSSFPEIDSIRKKFFIELSKMKESGEYDSIRAKYLPLKLPKRKFVFICEKWRPFEYLQNGTPKGIDVEIVDIIMRKLKIPYEIKFYPWARAWMLVKKGKADAVLSISYKPSREKFLYYTASQRAFAETGKLPKEYLWISQYNFFVKKSKLNKINFSSYSQVLKAKYRVGRNKDYSYNEEFMKSGIPATLTVSNTKDGFSALVLDKIDLYPMDKTIGLAEVSDMGMENSIDYLPKPMFSKPYLVPFIKKSNYPNLEDIMNKFYRELEVLRKDGTYDKIYKKYTTALKLDQ